MYTLPRHDYLRRSVYGAHNGSWRAVNETPANHSERVKRSLKDVGVSRMALRSMEAKYLPAVIHPDEYIGGVVYGKHEDGFAMLVATDKRVIFLDRKPLFTNEDEVNYYVVSGVSYGNAGLAATVVLHTRIKDYKLRTFNPKSATIFVEFIETRCLEHEDPQEENNGKFN